MVSYDASGVCAVRRCAGQGAWGGLAAVCGRTWASAAGRGRGGVWQAAGSLFPLDSFPIVCCVDDEYHGAGSCVDDVRPRPSLLRGLRSIRSDALELSAALRVTTPSTLRPTRSHPGASTHDLILSAWVVRADGKEEVGLGHPAHTVAVHPAISSHNHAGPPRHRCHVQRPPPVQLHSMYHTINVYNAGSTRIPR